RDWLLGPRGYVSVSAVAPLALVPDQPVTAKEEEHGLGPRFIEPNEVIVLDLITGQHIERFVGWDCIEGWRLAVGEVRKGFPVRIGQTAGVRQPGPRCVIDSSAANARLSAAVIEADCRQAQQRRE